MADESSPIGQNEIDALLKQVSGGGAAAPTPAASAAPEPTTGPKASASAKPGDPQLAQSDVEYLLNQAEQALASVNAPSGGELPSGVKPFKLPDFASAPASADSATLDLIRDVELDLRIELGRTHMYLEEVLKLSKGSVVALDKLAGDPVDIFVNGRLIARGEVLILNENFCVRVAELVVPETMRASA